jgi:hypothetical protein
MDSLVIDRLGFKWENYDDVIHQQDRGQVHWYWKQCWKIANLTHKQFPDTWPSV